MIVFLAILLVPFGYWTVEASITLTRIQNREYALERKS